MGGETMNNRQSKAALLSLLGLALLMSACAANRNCIEGDCASGTGTLLLPDGRRYTGQFVNGSFNGSGRYTWLDGRQYTGEFKNNAFDGKGKLSFPDGKAYEGQFRENRFDGKGTYTFANGNRYQGEFRNDAFHGQGEFTFADGKRYTGAFVENRFEGYGVYTFPDGSVYRGQFKNDLFNGEGEYTFANGEKLSGIFKEGRWQAPDNDSIVLKTDGDGSANDVLQTAEQRQQEEQAALRAYEATLSDEELERLVKPIPGRYAADNLRIYQELLRRHPDNERYRKKVNYYRSVVDKQKRP